MTQTEATIVFNSNRNSEFIAWFVAQALQWSVRKISTNLLFPKDVGGDVVRSPASLWAMVELVEECVQMRAHVGECKLGTVCPEEAQQCFHAMLLGQPIWLATLSGGFCSPSDLCLRVWVHKDNVLVSWFSQHTAEHILHMISTCRLLHPIQEYVKIVLQRLLLCVSLNGALFQSGQLPLLFSPPCTCRKTENCAPMYVLQSCEM